MKQPKQQTYKPLGLRAGSSLVQFSARTKVELNRTEVKTLNLKATTFFLYSYVCFKQVAISLYAIFPFSYGSMEKSYIGKLNEDISLPTAPFEYITVNLVILGSLRLTTWRQQHWCLSPGLGCKVLWFVFLAELFSGLWLMQSPTFPVLHNLPWQTRDLQVNK